MKTPANHEEWLSAHPPVSEKPPPGGPWGLPAFVTCRVVTTPSSERVLALNSHNHLTKGSLQRSHLLITRLLGAVSCGKEVIWLGSFAEQGLC